MCIDPSIDIQRDGVNLTRFIMKITYFAPQLTDRKNKQKSSAVTFYELKIACIKKKQLSLIDS